MGGLNSGKGIRRNAWRSKKMYTTKLPKLNIHKIIKLFKDNINCYLTWCDLELRLDGTRILLRSLKDESLPHAFIETFAKPCHYGGFHFLGCCPICSKRFQSLYLYKTFFACRQCFRMVYPSQNETLYIRLLHKYGKVKAKIKDDPWKKPKWMRRRTFENLRRQYHHIDDQIDMAYLRSSRSIRETNKLLEQHGSAEVLMYEMEKRFWKN